MLHSIILCVFEKEKQSKMPMPTLDEASLPGLVYFSDQNTSSIEKL